MKLQPGVIGVLTAMRIKSGVSRPRLCKKLGCALRSLQSWEGGEVPPTYGWLTKWAAHFDCEIYVRPKASDKGDSDDDK